ncbi:hypothetical protein [Streptomyces laculatispora]|uniref:hypothetical protein n=1 Tax=Streptomyces laculatispora TaxID=887464 RepID=UPI001A93B216|nr:hypothetical protein [Streptomyces laculatispora]MBO0914879.1 hypothetical protein [Streptomyces laculatispora]
MTYDTERAPLIPTESPEAAEQRPVAPDRAAEQPLAAPDRGAEQPLAAPDGGAGAVLAADRPLFPEGDQERLILRLQHAVTEFVESPLRAVGEAESAFDAAVDGLASALKERRREMGTQQQGEESGTRTEELRITLQQYRDLTERLLNV